MKKTEGQSLIEVLTALAIAVIIIISLVAGVSYALRNLTFAKNKTLASQYAREGVERARQARNEEAAKFFTDGYCNPWGPDNPDGKGIFTREWNCSYDEDKEWMDVTVTVSWPDGSTTQTTEVKTRLTDWR